MVRNGIEEKEGGRDQRNFKYGVLRLSTRTREEKRKRSKKNDE